MNEGTDFEGFSLVICGENDSTPAFVNNEPFTLGGLAVILINLLNYGVSGDEWRQSTACFRSVLKPGKGTVAQSLVDKDPHDEVLEVDFNIMGGTLLPPAQGTVVILRNKDKCCWASVSLALNPWMLSGPEEWLDRISYELYWAALICGYDGDNVRGSNSSESGNRFMIFENAKTHCVLTARYDKKPASSFFYVRMGQFGRP